MIDNNMSQIAVLQSRLALDIVRVTESAAIAAARLRGRGDEAAADLAALDAMYQELNRLEVGVSIVVGEGEKDDVPHLYVGEKCGRSRGTKLDFAVDALEGTTICAKSLPNALTLVAVAETGGFLRTPNIYMEKIAVGPGYPEGIIDLEASPSKNVTDVAKAKGVPTSELTVCILDRPRHARLIAEVRETGAGVRLIGDGDIAGVIHTSDPDETGIDLYLGSGGAPEGVLAAAALRCTGGQMLGRLMVQNDEQMRLVNEHGIKDPSHVFSADEMAKGDVLFAATGVTDGNFLTGVRFLDSRIKTHSIVMSSASGTIRSIKSNHRDFTKGV
ncbi:Fructose-1,6-bisphosphatase class 2 [Hartmannibacter diazotrophicus]|uniref:Fructose-1,6-bisphosphatase n=1 Tax=Hartmannibacter diazotrophicus TaxID=1482074 RepID=A0A2C9D7L7_9HYPH|nr:class II fructose-bisphosphatase [Hartmannibacter diazotrophicus]SON56312.1 Fructose-1,6-bisphosphatase class 2 [Hartmannibacter diazotrophicus]